MSALFEKYNPERCLNCGTNFEATTRFCPSCGQRNKAHRRTLIEWMLEGAASFFHLEGKLLNTLRDVFIPGRLVRNYLSGQRQRYVHPLRLLLFSSLLGFTLIRALNVEESTPLVQIESKKGADVVAKELGLSRLEPEEQLAGAKLTGADSVRITEALDDVATAFEDLVDGGEVASKMRQIDLLRSRIIAHDKLEGVLSGYNTRGGLEHAEAVGLADTLRQVFEYPKGINSKDLGTSTNLLAEETFAIDARTLAIGTPAQVVEASGLSNWINKLVLRKGVALYQEGVDSLSGYLWSSLSWGVLIYVPFLAFGYYMMYWRRAPYYTQHLAYAAVLLSVTMLVSSATLLAVYAGLGKWVWGLVFVSIVAYMVVGEARLYQTKIWKALLKNMALFVYGSITFSLAMVIWLTLAVLLS